MEWNNIDVVLIGDNLLIKEGKYGKSNEKNLSSSFQVNGNYVIDGEKWKFDWQDNCHLPSTTSTRWLSNGIST